MVRRIFWALFVLVVVYFTLQGGEYSTMDIIRQRGEKARLTFVVDSLRKQVDSLVKVEALIRGDPATQERIAREEFGMVSGDNEILYKFIDPIADDSSTIGQ